MVNWSKWIFRAANATAGKPVKRKKKQSKARKYVRRARWFL